MPADLGPCEEGAVEYFGSCSAHGPRLPLVGEIPYGRGFWPNVEGRGNLQRKLHNVEEKSAFVGDLYTMSVYV